ncbi:MAG TPA: hypothetical protein VG826_06265 [Pirellulales bacterium]|nr:hypothetical protein [Pirellulales bacterium]
MEEKRQFSVGVTNLTGCAMGISDINWYTTVSASSETEAAELAVKLAMAASADGGLPPHGIQLSEKEIRQNLVVLLNPPA